MSQGFGDQFCFTWDEKDGKTCFDNLKGLFEEEKKKWEEEKKELVESQRVAFVELNHRLFASEKEAERLTHAARGMQSYIDRRRSQSVEAHELGAEVEVVETGAPPSAKIAEVRVTREGIKYLIRWWSAGGVQEALVGHSEVKVKDDGLPLPCGKQTWVTGEVIGRLKPAGG